jgi:hypothetical protein
VGIRCYLGEMIEMLKVRNVNMRGSIRMQFYAVEPKMSMLLLFFLTLFMFIVSNEFVFLILAIIFIISTNIKYRFEIKKNNLLFITSVFGIDIIKRKTSNENIKWIEFKRTDWYKKSVFIRLKKGIRWKISRFKPDNFDEQIENFANTHSIAIKKQKIIKLRG